MGRDDSAASPAPRATAADYGEANAAVYDQIYPRLPAAALHTLLRLAGGRRVLDLGVGSGRCAWPLAHAGLEVVGVDASPSMLRRCRARGDAHRLTLLRADLARLPLSAGFGLAVSLVSTTSLLPDRAAQAACLAGVAAALHEGGCLVHEGDGEAPGQAHQVEIDWHGHPYRCRVLPLPPSLLDEYAHAAGLRLQARWRDWQGSPWNAQSAGAISVYVR